MSKVEKFRFRQKDLEETLLDKIAYFRCEHEEFMAHGTVIIGNGIAGITAAREMRKISNQRIQVISIETPYFFSRTALMYVYMGHMKFEHTQPYENWFWEKNRIELVQSLVEKVIPEKNELLLSTGEIISYDQLLIATGSKTQYFNWKGMNSKGVQGLYSFQDLQQLEKNTPKPFQKDHPTRKAIVIGAGLIGVELAEMLSTRDIEVTMIVREKTFWNEVLTPAEATEIGLHIESHGIKLLFESELDEVLSDHSGKVRAIRTTKGKELECQLVGIATGVVPNIDFLKETGIEVDKGILVNEYLETNTPNIYAAGDCAQLREALPGRKPIEAVWYVGRMMGEVAGANLAGKKTVYKPGAWFNSAKFFDIEYQTYGNVMAIAFGQQEQFFWKVKGKNKFMTIAWDKETEVFLGINTFGIRLRHEYFNNVLKKKMTVGEVMGGMGIANFDPEFYIKWDRALLHDFTMSTGIEIRKPNRLKKLLQR